MNADTIITGIQDVSTANYQDKYVLFIYSVASAYLFFISF